MVEQQVAMYRAAGDAAGGDAEAAASEVRLASLEEFLARPG